MNELETGVRATKPASNPELREAEKKPLTRLNRIIDQYPRISHDELLEMFRELRRTGNERLRDKIVACNLRLAVWFVRPWLNYNVSSVDLVQEALIGLGIAVDKYDPEYGVKFSAYAKPWMRSRVNRFLIKMGSPVKMPINRKVMDLPSRVSLDTPRIGDEWADRWSLLNDDRVNPPVPSPEEEIVANDEFQLRMAALQQVLTTLNARERDIIERRFLRDDPDTFDRIAQDYDVTAEAIRQAQIKAYNKVATRLRELVLPNVA